MSSRRTAGVLAALMLASSVAAGPPPADLEELLQREPVSANWARWSPRLREWSGEHYAAAAPAFRKAFEFVLSVQKGGRGKRPALAKPLDRDAVAWMVLAGAYLEVPGAAPGTVPAARAAAEAARAAVSRDKTLARAHFYLCEAYRREQTTPPDKGGPARPDAGTLRDALKALKQAFALDPNGKWMSPTEAGRLALAGRQWEDAEHFLRQALAAAPTEVETARLLAWAVTEQSRPAGGSWASGIEPLVKQFPNDGVLASHLGLALVRDNKRDEAAAQFARARELGTDPTTAVDAKMVREVEEEYKRRHAEERRRKTEADTRARIERAPRELLGTAGTAIAVFVLFYGGVMGLMCLTGVLLARRTRGPRAIEMLGAELHPVSGGKVTRTGHESRLERFYAVALAAALVLFYLSLPFVFVAMLAVFLLLAVLTLFVNRDAAAADVHGALLRASGGGIGALFRATFARTGTGGYGLEKDREDCPRLFEAIDEVARRVDTEPPAEVYVSPGADFGVHQEGRGPFGVFGSRKRVLTVGLCVLHFLTVSELKAILAHEFAHFSHADTHWNRYLFQVTLSLRTAMREMARVGGWVTYINPFYWFFWLYSRSYSLLSAGFSRSREFLADRMACSLYGSEVFTSALRKVCTDGSLFEMTIYQNIERLLREKKAFVNMYRAFRTYREEDLTESQRRKLNRKLLEDTPSLFASHPTFAEREEAARHLPAAEQTEAASAMTLFDDPEAAERELTDFLTDLMDRYRRF